MHKHITLPTLPIPGHQSGRVDRAHPAGGPVEEPGGGVDHDEVPLDVVNLTWEASEGEGALGESRVTHNPAFLRGDNLEELVGLRHLGVVGHVVGLEGGDLRLDLRDPLLVLF